LEALTEAITFAAEDKVRAQLHEAHLEEINGALCELKVGKVDGRIVLGLT